MIIGIMQPYLFPYIGYFQLIKQCDVFVVHDDVQYISGGWINRNRILVNGEPSIITLPVREAPHRLPINGRDYLLEAGGVERFLRKVEAAYRKAPQFGFVFPLLSNIMMYKDSNVANFNVNSILPRIRQMAR